MATPYIPKKIMASSPSKSTSSSKKSTNKTSKTLSEIPVKLDKNDSVSIREIENGFIVNQSGYTGKGKNQQWYNKEYFSSTNPIKFSGKK